MSNYPASIGDVFYYIGKTYEIHEAFPTQQYFVARELGNFDNMIKITLFELQCCPHWEKANFFSYTHEPILISKPARRFPYPKRSPYFKSKLRAKNPSKAKPYIVPLHWKSQEVQEKPKPKGIK